MMRSATTKARFADNYKYLIDRNGQKRHYNDPKVTHVWTYTNNEYHLEIMGHIFTKQGWNHRILPQLTPQNLENAKRICSGRECVFFSAASGAIYTDLMENRPDDELTLYHNLNLDNPCQSKIWQSLWDIFGEKLGIENALFMQYADVLNNFLGQGFMLGKGMGEAVILGDIFREARVTLRCLSEDDPAALEVFDRETEKVLETFRYKIPRRRKALARWADQVSKIPLRHTKKDVPEVLVYGGGELELIHEPVVEYFLSQGLIPKVQDFSSFAYQVLLNTYLHYSIKQGLLSVEAMANIPLALLTTLKSLARFKLDIPAATSGIYALGFEFLRKYYYNLADKSGLIHPFYTIPLQDISMTGDRQMTFNAVSESPQAVGTFLTATESGMFDGLLHLITFNCQPALNTQAMIRPLAAEIDIPHATIDIETHELAANNIKTLETLAVQARRHHRERTGWVH